MSETPLDREVQDSLRKLLSITFETSARLDEIALGVLAKQEKHSEMLEHHSHEIDKINEVLVFSRASGKPALIEVVTEQAYQIRELVNGLESINRRASERSSLMNGLIISLIVAVLGSLVGVIGTAITAKD